VGGKQRDTEGAREKYRDRKSKRKTEIIREGDTNESKLDREDRGIHRETEDYSEEQQENRDRHIRRETDIEKDGKTKKKKEIDEEKF